MAKGRRNFLKMAAFGCVSCLAAARGHAAAGHSAAPHPHWSYDGPTGPERWGELQPSFRVCQLGLEQTPIDLANGMKGDTGAVSFDYKNLPLRIVNNGHTIQLNADAGSSATIAGTPYQLLQFHLHHPSEHLLNGQSFAMECHFVHKSDAGALAVVGVFIRAGAKNPALATLFDAMPRQEGPEVKAQGTLSPELLLPKSSSYYRYMGSLTTPPCSEGLTWTVFKDPIEAAPEQIQQFAALFPNNARPVQNRGRRFLLETN